MDRSCRAGRGEFWKHQLLAGQRVRRNSTDGGRRTVLRQMMRHVARGEGFRVAEGGRDAENAEGGQAGSGRRPNDLSDALG